MDPDVEIMYSVPDGCLVSREKLQVNLSTSYNRRPLPPEHEESINKVWSTRVKDNPKMWNGTKFRLDSVKHEGDVATFNLGITSYKDFIGTNWSPNAHLFRKLNIHEDGVLEGKTQLYMSDALGVGALLQTADNYIVLLKRSMHCGEAVGLFDIPGGHPEPQELVGRIEAEQINLAALSPDDVVNEIFDSILREVSDEVNVPKSSLSDPLLLGVARNTTSAGRPSSEYFIRCSHTSKEIEEFYNRGDHAEADESTNIKMVDLEKLPKLQEDTQLWCTLAPSAKGCIILYQIFLQNGGHVS